jgi:hypothetical protein
MQQGYKEYTVSGFRDYQDIILDIPLDVFTLYRGQSSDKPLLPKIARYNLEDVRKVEREMLADFKRRSLHLIEHYHRKLVGLACTCTASRNGYASFGLVRKSTQCHVVLVF